MLRILANTQYPIGFSFVCLSVNSITEKKLVNVFGTRNHPEHFRDGPFYPLHTENIFRQFGGNSCVLGTLRIINDWIFMKFSATVGHETRNILEHFWDVAANPLNPGSVFLFSGFVIVGYIME